MGDKGSKDKGKKEEQKKAKLTPKEKKKAKKEKKQNKQFQFPPMIFSDAQEWIWRMARMQRPCEGLNPRKVLLRNLVPDLQTMQAVGRFRFLPTAYSLDQFPQTQILSR